MAYKHGIYGREVATSLVPMTQINAGLPVVFGTAPVHLATDRAKANQPVLCYKYAEAVQALGYSVNWKDYTLCEFMYSQFSLFNMAPAVFVNVLDAAIHKVTVSGQSYGLSEEKILKLPASEAVLLETLKISPEGNPEEYLTKNVDYTAAYNSDGELVVTVLKQEVGAGSNIILSYDKLNPSAVSYTDIIGGVDLGGNTKEVNDILISLSQTDSRNKSSKYATYLVKEMAKSVKLVKNTHRFAGFAVLKAPDMPSALLEMGYLSNKTEEANLKTPAYRKKLANSAAAAIDKYFSDPEIASN